MTRFALTLVLPLLAACTTTGSVQASALNNTEWTFVAIDGQAPVSDRARIAFRKDRLSASVGCNRMGGSWRIEKGRLVGGPYASTMMFCDGLMEQERAVGELLGDKPVVTIEGRRLTLASANHRAELVLAD